MDKFCMTQKTPTQRSATAKLARKKFVVLRRRRDIVTTRITSKLPATMDIICNETLLLPTSTSREFIIFKV